MLFFACHFLLASLITITHFDKKYQKLETDSLNQIKSNRDAIGDSSKLKGNKMFNFIAIPSIIGVALLVAGFLAHSRQVSEGSFKHWFTQCLAATLYSAGYSLIFASGFVWLAVTNHWNQSNSNSIVYVAVYLPLFMAFITTFLVEIKYRDFGTSALAMAIGTLSGLYFASAIASML